MTNCIVDYDDSVRIPQNEEDFFLIEKSKTWKHSIQISFNMNHTIDYLNLFFILKSYALDNFCPCYAFGTSFLSLNNKMIITQKESIDFIKKTNFDKFSEWINYRIKNDWEYEKRNNFYSLLLVFEKNLITLNNQKYDTDLIAKWKPKYPWTPEWVKYFEKSMEYTKFLEEKIKSLENELKKIK
jgi:hypothetical protein